MLDDYLEFLDRKDHRDNCMNQKSLLKCHRYFLLGYVTGLWSRLAEIGIRATFIVFTSTTALIFD